MLLSSKKRGSANIPPSVCNIPKVKSHPNPTRTDHRLQHPTRNTMCSTQFVFSAQASAIKTLLQTNPTKITGPAPCSRDPEPHVPTAEEKYHAKNPIYYMRRTPGRVVAMCFCIFGPTSHSVGCWAWEWSFRPSTSPTSHLTSHLIQWLEHSISARGASTLRS